MNRYNMTVTVGHYGGVYSSEIPTPNGAWVRYEDHLSDKLQETARADAAEKAHAEAMELLREWVKFEGMYTRNTMGIDEWYAAKDAHLAKYGKDVSK